MEQSDDKYINGFNSGYLLSEHQPSFLINVLTSKGDSKYIDGLKAGEIQFKKDIVLLKLNNKSGAKNKDLEL